MHAASLLVQNYSAEESANAAAASAVVDPNSVSLAIEGSGESGAEGKADAKRGGAQPSSRATQSSGGAAAAAAEAAKDYLSLLSSTLPTSDSNAAIGGSRLYPLWATDVTMIDDLGVSTRLYFR